MINLIADYILRLLGLAQRAGKVITGDEAITNALPSKKIKIVFVAKDASFNTKDKYEKKCFYYNVEVNFDYDCAQLSKAIGKEMRKIIAITDDGFYNSYLSQKRGEKHES